MATARSAPDCGCEGSRPFARSCQRPRSRTCSSCLGANEGAKVDRLGQSAEVGVGPLGAELLVDRNMEQPSAGTYAGSGTSQVGAVATISIARFWAAERGARHRQDRLLGPRHMRPGPCVVGHRHQPAQQLRVDEPRDRREQRVDDRVKRRHRHLAHRAADHMPDHSQQPADHRARARQPSSQA
jgi:hypothetical protein